MKNSIVNISRTKQGTQLTVAELEIASMLLNNKEWVDTHNGNKKIEEFHGSVWLMQTNRLRTERAVVALIGGSYCSINELYVKDGVVHLSIRSIGPTVESVPAAHAAEGWSQEGVSPGSYCVLEYIGDTF